jgi:hypothetical protein
MLRLLERHSRPLGCFRFSRRWAAFDREERGEGAVVAREVF